MATMFKAQSPRSVVVWANNEGLPTALAFAKACVDANGMVGMLLPKSVEITKVTSFFEADAPGSTNTPKPRSATPVPSGSSASRLFPAQCDLSGEKEQRKASLQNARSAMLMNAGEIATWQKNRTTPTKLTGVEGVIAFSSMTLEDFLNATDGHLAGMDEATAVFGLFYRDCLVNSTRGFTIVFVLPEVDSSCDLEAYWSAARRVENDIRTRMDGLTNLIGDVPVNAVVCLPPPSQSLGRELFVDHIKPESGLSPWGQKYLGAFRDMPKPPKIAADRNLVCIEDIANVVMLLTFNNPRLRGNVVHIDGGAFRDQAKR